MEYVPPVFKRLCCIWPESGNYIIRIRDDLFHVEQGVSKGVGIADVNCQRHGRCCRQYFVQILYKMPYSEKIYDIKSRTSIMTFPEQANFHNFRLSEKQPAYGFQDFSPDLLRQQGRISEKTAVFQLSARIILQSFSI